MKKDKVKGIDCSYKATSIPLKPQIQGPKTKERKKSPRTLPLDCWEKREIKGFLMCLGKKLERKRERICLEKCSKIAQFLFFIFII